ncbi:DUF4339 domain-containing protein, partial [Planctomycetaceae bacterium]|nr:DUF4339 domain-containing protein [Planctomycetaceae bacterium]
RMADLHVRRGDKVLGPFPPDKIKQMIADGKIRQNDLIRVEGDDQWNSIGDIPNLAKLFGLDNPPATTKRPKSPKSGSGSSDSQTVFIKRGDEIHGPLTLTAVEDGIAAGKIEPSDQIGPRKTGPWEEAGTVARLFPTEEVVTDEFEGFEFEMDEDEPDDSIYDDVPSSPRAAKDDADPYYGWRFPLVIKGGQGVGCLAVFGLAIPFAVIIGLCLFLLGVDPNEAEGGFYWVGGVVSWIILLLAVPLCTGAYQRWAKRSLGPKRLSLLIAAHDEYVERSNKAFNKKYGAALSLAGTLLVVFVVLYWLLFGRIRFYVS